MSVDTSKTLIARLEDHADEHAWSVFCDVYGPLIYRYLVSRGTKVADAADIAQEVLLRVAKAVKSFEYDRAKGRFRDWLLRITTNEMRRWHSRGKGDSSSSQKLIEEIEEVAREDWSEQFEQHVFQIALERVQAKVETSTWDLFELTWLKGKSAKDVANAAGEKIETVYHAKSRVLKKLRLEVLDLADDTVFFDHRLS